MESGPSAGATFLVFLLLMQLVATIALILGGMYLLYCFQRASAGLDRLATVAEMWLERQQRLEAQFQTAPPTGVSPTNLNPTSTVVNPPVAPSISSEINA